MWAYTFVDTGMIMLATPSYAVQELHMICEICDMHLKSICYKYICLQLTAGNELERVQYLIIIVFDIDYQCIQVTDKYMCMYSLVLTFYTVMLDIISGEQLSQLIYMIYTFMQMCRSTNGLCIGILDLWHLVLISQLCTSATYFENFFGTILYPI